MNAASGRPVQLPTLALYAMSVAATRTWCKEGSDSVKRHLPIEYARDLIPVVAAKGSGASWNARGMAETA